MAGFTVLATLASGPACKAEAQQGTAASPAPAAGSLATEEDKTLYALGLVLGRNVTDFALTPRELEIVRRGFADAAGGGKQDVDIQVYGPKVRDLAMAKQKARAEAQGAAGAAFLETAAKEPGAVKTPSGMVYVERQKGSGPNPKPTDTVKVHYKGTLIDGKTFDSSYDRGQPAQFPLNGVIPCWTEAVQTMKVGGKARIVCPSELAYGERGSPPQMRGGATLVFDIELLEIVKEDPAAAGAGPALPPPAGNKPR